MISKSRPTIGHELARGALKELIEFRKSLSPELSPDEFRDALVTKADQVGVPLLAKAAALRRGEAEATVNLRELVHWVVDMIFAGREDVTIGDAVTWLDEVAGFTPIMLEFLDELVAGGKVNAVPDLVGGHCFVRSVPLGDGFKIPVMISVATPFTPRKAWLDETSFRFQKEFAPMAQMKPESLLEAARALPGWMEDRESRDIADELFEEEGFRDTLQADSAVERERAYGKALKSRAARLRKRKQHFLEVVNKVMRGSSQE